MGYSSFTTCLYHMTLECVIQACKGLFGAYKRAYKCSSIQGLMPKSVRLRNGSFLTPHAHPTAQPHHPHTPVRHASLQNLSQNAATMQSSAWMNRRTPLWPYCMFYGHKTCVFAIRIKRKARLTYHIPSSSETCWKLGVVRPSSSPAPIQLSIRESAIRIRTLQASVQSISRLELLLLRPRRTHTYTHTPSARRIISSM